jgi:prolyl-tRNA synthetase
MSSWCWRTRGKRPLRPVLPAVTPPTSNGPNVDPSTEPSSGGHSTDGPSTDGPRPSLPMDNVATPGVGAVEAVSRLLNVSASKIIKTVFYVADGKPVVALVRGDRELNEHKLKRVLGAKLLFKAGDDVYRQTASCEPGFAGPLGLNARCGRSQRYVRRKRRDRREQNGFSCTQRQSWPGFHVPAQVADLRR